MSTTRPRPVHLLLVAAFLLLGACAGGGQADDATEPVDQAASGTESAEDDGSAAQPGADGVGDTPEPEPPSATPTPTATATAAAPTPEALATADPPPTDGAGTTEGAEAFCAAAATFVELFDGPDPSTPEETQAYFETAITILDTMADVAPGEAAETVAGTRDFFVEVDQLAADVDYDVDAADEDALEELEQRYGATLDGFETVVADGCDLDL